MHVGKKVTKKVSHERFGCSLPTFSVGVLLSMRIDARVTKRRQCPDFLEKHATFNIIHYSIFDFRL